ncbi:RagB/SusD family nutrient uptake outer membrane protein [Pedobacter sp. BS3]|uniref:RagB/SusD family nutrient uptake outer membrane protein n=1 Tax=Pedobacter sp. BS3 TaxID=2567937 RepID=UPI0011EFC510|nr:RagB/SusD family nutrient uptake outer membrane protein [Pedobacter sp. BS3]TZF82591.1 RagB/SusD family nutrient uptake outer membrane protein [Pedobacter sp. BS3]
MRKIFSISIALVALLTTSCKKFLEETPTDFISPENYFTNEAGLNSALTGVYDILGKEEVYGSYIPLMHAQADEGFYSRSAQTTGTQVYNFDASDSSVGWLWTYLYQGIERANLLLANIDNVPVDDQAAKNAIKGAAKFLRAYYYFMLVDYFGDVPLKTTPSTSVNNVDIARTPVKEVYNFIVSEMEEAEGMVYTADKIGYGGRISKTTVEGILARVYLTMAGEPLKDVSKYADALKWAQKVKASGLHSLNSDFKNIFIRYCSDQYDIKESMWEVELYGNRGGDFEAGRIGNTIGLQCNDQDYGYSYGFINTTAKLYNSYESTDTRRDWTIAPYQYTYNVVNGVSTVKDSTFFTSTQIYNRNCGKWRRIYEKVLPRNKNYTPINFPLLRYSDVLLMIAEAENEVNGPTDIAKNALKEVRDRAHASDLTTAISDPGDFRKLVKAERYRELAFEGLRKHDLIRWGEFVSTMNDIGTDITNTGGTNYSYGALAGKNVRVKHKLFPIPINEISLNRAMVQNPGW